MFALTALRLLELKLGDKYTSKKIIEEMHNFDCVLSWQPGARKPELTLEEPNAFQSEVLEALGYVIKDGWVLQN